MHFAIIFLSHNEGTLHIMKKINSSFQTRLFINISTVIILTISISTAFMSYAIYKTQEKKILISQQQITATTGQLVDKLIDDMDNLALFLASSPNIANAFCNLRFNPNIKDPQRYLTDTVADSLTAVTIPNSSTSFRINLFDQDGNFVTTGIPVNYHILNEHTKCQEYLQWYLSLPVKINKPYINAPSSDYLSTSDKMYVSLYREIFHPSFVNLPIGIVEIQCPENKFLTLLDKNDIYSYALIDKDDNTIMTNLPTQNLESKNYITSKADLKCGYTLYMYQARNSIHTIISPIIWGVIFISMLISSLMLYVIFVVTKHTTKPLCKLTDQIENISINNLNIVTPKVTGINELDKLYSTFSDMCKRLNISIDENLKIKSCELRSNLIALQSQMNPHFLYNTLSTIKAMSKENNTQQINNICDYLSKMLRYSSSHDKSLVSLSTELEHAELYLKLMKIRYEDLFEYKIDIEPGFNPETKQIIKLSIQPMLENCFQHGFKKVLPVWKIKIRCWQNENHWFIAVSDNGYGITDDQISTLHDRLNNFLNNPSDSISELSIGGMGLVNTLARLNLYFKDNFTFKIIKEKERGTTIQIGGLDYDEHYDR